MVLGLAPLFLWPIAFLSFTVLVAMLDVAAERSRADSRPLRAALRRAAHDGWWFGFGYFLFGLYWIANALLVEADTFAWLLPFAVTLIPAGLACYHAIGASIAAVLWRPGPARVVALAIGFTVAEYLRTYVLTGFPWNEIGYLLTADDGMLQWASVGGIHALTLAAVLLFASPALLLDRGKDEPARRVRLGFMVAVVAMLLTLLAGRMVVERPQVTAGGGPRIRLVQPNIAQSEKWDPDNKGRLFRHLIDLTRRGPDGTDSTLGAVDLVIWPESSIPFLLLDTPEALAEIAALLPAGVQLVTGAVRAEPMPSASVAGEQQWRFYNSVLVLDDAAKLVDRYDKRHLVPFGEYLPLQRLLESLGFEQLTRQRGGFAAGAGQQRISIQSLGEVRPLICYEAIFPDESSSTESRAPTRLLLNLTNDAWFGLSPGPYQHVQHARVRAVEQGAPLIRVANTGISTVIDRYGRPIAGLGLGKSGVVDVEFHRHYVGATTIFGRLGNTAPLAALLSLVVVWLALNAALPASTEVTRRLDR